MNCIHLTFQVQWWQMYGHLSSCNILGENHTNFENEMTYFGLHRWCSVVRPAMLYGAETWATTKRQESRIEVNEMRMLRWMCGVTRKDKIRNEHIRGTTKVAQASRKITERRLKWYGHVMRMEEDHVVKRVMTKAIPGKRKRGRPKTRWKDVCKRDMQTVGLREGDAGDRAYWKEMINNHSGDPRWREKPEEKKKKKMMLHMDLHLFHDTGALILHSDTLDLILHPDIQVKY